MTPSSRQTEEYFMDRETRRLKYASLTFSESIDCAELNTEYYTNRISLHK